MEQHLASPTSELADRYDVVIVGSGYGASVAALRYAEAGHSVAVLERGREHPTGSFPQGLSDLRRELQITSASGRSGRPDALFDMRLGRDMHVLVGCGLGGGSLVNAGVALRPDPRVFADPAWPVEIGDLDRLDEGYARARHWLRPATDPAAPDTRKLAALREASGALGVPPAPAEVVVSFSETTNPAGLRQPACTRCGDCCSGCNVGAKNTLALTYLPAARAAGARLFEHARVSHLTRTQGRWLVHVELADGPDTSIRRTRAIAAERVVLGAGSLGTTEILLRSAANGLALSSRLGQRFSANGDIIAFGMANREPVGAIGIGHPAKPGTTPVGAAVTGQIMLRDPGDLEREMTIQEGVLPSALAPVLPVFFLPGGRLLGAAAALLKGVYKGPLAHLSTYFVVGHDSAAGQLRLESDRLSLVWPGVGEEPVQHRVDANLTALVEAGGGRYVKSPLAMTTVGSTPATAHPLGGAGMGADVRSGVVDHLGRVFDAAPGNADTNVHDGLFVLDGALIPRSLGCNPLLTITALAERALLAIRRN